MAKMSDIGDSTESDSVLGQDDSELALSGIRMLLNNGFDEAQALFDKYKYAPYLGLRYNSLLCRFNK